MKISSKKISLIAFLVCCCFIRPAAGVEFPFIQGLSYFPFFENKLMKKTDFSIALRVHHSNIYSYSLKSPETMLNDFEMTSTLLAFRYGLFNKTVLEFFYRYFYVFGGFMDKSIEDFHNLFNLASAGRENFPRNIVQFEYKDYFNYDSGTGSHSPLVFSLLQQYFSSEFFSIYGRLFLGIPLKSKPGFVSDKLFWGTGLVFDFKKNHFSFNLAAYISFFPEPIWLNGEDMNNSIFYLDMQVKFKRLLSGFILKTSPIKKGNLSHNAHQIYVGYKISDNFEIGIIEDLTKFDTTPDICLYFWVKIL